MSFKLDWENLPSSNEFKKKSDSSSAGGTKRRLNFINFTDDSTHIVRPVGTARGFWRFYHPPTRRYFVANVEKDEKGRIVESNIDELREILGCDPEPRFAINVIDRADQQIKILQGPMTIVEQMSEHAQTTKKRPGGPEGGDWKITSKGSKKSRRYNCNFLDSTPFTEEELNKINNPDQSKNEWYILKEVFKPSDADYVSKVVKGEESPKPVEKPIAVGATVGATAADNESVIDF